MATGWVSKTWPQIGFWRKCHCHWMGGLIYWFLRHVTGWVSEAWPLGGFLGHAGCHFLVVPKKKYLPIFLYFCLFSSHYSEIFAQSQDWQNSVTQKHGTSAWQNRIENFGPPLRGYIFGRTGLSFGRKKLLAPPKNAPGTPM